MIGAGRIPTIRLPRRRGLGDCWVTSTATGQPVNCTGMNIGQSIWEPACMNTVMNSSLCAANPALLGGGAGTPAFPVLPANPPAYMQDPSLPGSTQTVSFTPTTPAGAGAPDANCLSLLGSDQTFICSNWVMLLAGVGGLVLLLAATGGRRR